METDVLLFSEHEIELNTNGAVIEAFESRYGFVWNNGT